MITHYTGPKAATANPAWLREMIAMETEGEITPAQSDREPHEVVMDESTPALLRKQAA